MKRFAIIKQYDAEICHYASADRFIVSKNRQVFDKGELIFHFPGDGWKALFSWSRLFRRASRLDKCNVFPVRGGFVGIRRGKVYHYSVERGTLTETLSLRNCACVMNQSIAATDQGVLFFGEYGRNPQRGEVPIYRSIDHGQSWHVIFTFRPGETRHIHGCFFDPVENKIWVLCGDFKNECKILVADTDFQQLEWIGDGTQRYRSCGLFFEQGDVHFFMDSQLEENFHFVLDRKTRQIEKLSSLPGPVWFVKQLDDGYYLIATAQEKGQGVSDDFAHLLISRDLKSWLDIKQFRKDRLPHKYFKNGIVAFCHGNQSSLEFFISTEALSRIDGKVLECSIR